MIAMVIEVGMIGIEEAAEEDLRIMKVKSCDVSFIFIYIFYLKKKKTPCVTCYLCPDFMIDRLNQIKECIVS